MSVWESNSCLRVVHSANLSPSILARNRQNCAPSSSITPTLQYSQSSLHLLLHSPYSLPPITYHPSPISYHPSFNSTYLAIAPNLCDTETADGLQSTSKL